MMQQQQKEEEATIRETKSLMSGQLEATTGAEDADGDEGLHSNGADAEEEEGIEQPMDEAQGLPFLAATGEAATETAANGGDTAFIEKTVDPSKSQKKLIHKSSSLLADAAHISMPLYRHPRQRQRWGDTQVHPVKEWGT
jgi:hypothetical protein